jgi:hypothetical protein
MFNICRPPYDYTQLYIFPEIDTHTHLKKKCVDGITTTTKIHFLNGWICSTDILMELCCREIGCSKGQVELMSGPKRTERDDNNNSKWSESLSYSLVLWYPIVCHRELATTTPTESCTHINYSQSDRQTEIRVLGAPLVVVVFIINK